MSEVVSIRLTPENASNLDVLQKRQSIVLDDLINRALSNYFFASRTKALKYFQRVGSNAIRALDKNRGMDYD
jgi:hypothetical protein